MTTCMYPVLKVAVAQMDACAPKDKFAMLQGSVSYPSNVHALTVESHTRKPIPSSKIVTCGMCLLAVCTNLPIHKNRNLVM